MTDRSLSRVSSIIGHLSPSPVVSETQLAPCASGDVIGGLTVPARRVILCAHCEVAKAGVHCRTCKQYFCLSCSKVLHIAPRFKDHELIDIRDLASYIVPGTDIHRSPFLPDDHLIDSYLGMRTAYELFQHAVKATPDSDCLGTRSHLPDGSRGDYEWITYAQVDRMSRYMGAALLSLGVTPRSKIGLYSQNRYEWVVTEQACHRHAVVTVPLYDTLGPDAVEYIVRQAQLPVLFTSTANLDKVLDVAARTSSIRLVVHFDPLVDTQSTARHAHANASFKVMSFAELLALGERIGAKPDHPPKPDDIFTICYTSGTTGDPKGAMITHGQVMANVGAVDLHGSGMSFGDVHISYLPLPHMFERMLQAVCFGKSVAIGFFCGDVLTLLDDIQMLRPTKFPSVPRLYNRIYDKIKAAIAEGGYIKQKLFDIAYASKKRSLADGVVTHALWDRLVFSKVQARLGGRVAIMTTGSAPIASDVLDFLRICFCCQVIEGYGQTEATAAVTMTALDAFEPGNVGVPAGSCEVKLVDVPEMGYTSADRPYPRGEVCVRGPSVFPGYYDRPDLTAEAIDREGWLHSGDIGAWVNGNLKIIDRKKNIFKLAQGEYVAPEKIENIYTRSPYIMQAFVHGDSLQSYLVGVIVIDPETIVPWAVAHGLDSDINKIPDDKLRKLLAAELESQANSAKLAGFERLRHFHIEREPFSVENNMLTPTFKLKRPICVKHYAGQIKAMYSQ